MYVAEHIVSSELPTVIAFSSVNTREGRFKPYRLVVRSGVNVIFVNDIDNRWYQNGVPGISECSRTAAEILVQKGREIGNGRVVTFGSSMGAYGAILFASLGGADGCLAFGCENPLGLDGGRFKMHYRGDGNIPYPDISDHVNETTNFFTCENDEIDLLSALSVVGKCSVYSLPGAEHPGLQTLENGGKHSRIIRALADGQSVHEEAAGWGWALSHPELVKDLYRCLLLKQSNSREWLPAIKAVADRWEHPTAFLRLGEAYRRDGKNKDAREAWETTIALCPMNGTAHHKLGALPDTPHDDSVGFFRKAIDLDPTNAHAHFGLAEVLARVDDFSGAEIHYKAAAKINRGNKQFSEALSAFLERMARDEHENNTKHARRRTAAEIRSELVSLSEELTVSSDIDLRKTLARTLSLLIDIIPPVDLYD